MKILELRFKNLNSIYGEWQIDFTAPQYVQNGIFAITGPTGAGKSTLLDALCLGLYGRTPRLNNISKNAGNEVMSRRTGECFAEVCFETGSGIFRTYWSQRRAREKSDGALQDTKHEISNATNGKILESKKRDTEKLIEEVTGMDFDRFTRTMLLAQGGFAAFLNARPDERSPILEQITGAEIYSAISIQVHTKCSEEHNKLKLILAEADGIILLNTEQELELLTELKQKEADENILSKKQEKFQTDIQKLKNIQTLKIELQTISEESQTLDLEFYKFQPERQSLQIALKAAGLEIEYTGLESLRRYQDKELQELSISQNRIPSLEKALSDTQTAMEKADTALSDCRESQKKELGIIKEVRTLDYKISEKQKTLKLLVQENKKLEDELTNKKKQEKSENHNLAEIKKKLAETDVWLTEHKNDAELIASLAVIKERIKTLQEFEVCQSADKKDIAQLKKKALAAKNKHKKQETALRTAEQKHNWNIQAVNETKQALAAILQNRLLKEYRLEQEALLREMAYLSKIRDLENERELLKDGIPCPLCGALHHPFAVQDQIPKTDETEKKIQKLRDLINKSEHFEKQLKDQEIAEKNSGLELHKTEKEEALSSQQQQEAETTLLRMEKESEKTKAKMESHCREISLSLEPFGITYTTSQNPEELLIGLNARQKAFQDAQSWKIKFERTIIELEAKISGLCEAIQNLERRNKESREKHFTAQEELNFIERDRHKIFGTKDPDQEEAELERKITAAETALKKATKTRDNAREKLQEILTRITALKDSTSPRKKELTDLTQSFIIACQQSGFQDEKQFLAGKLSPENRNKLANHAKNLDERIGELKTRKKDREARLSIEQKEKSEFTLEQLENTLVQTHEAIKKLTQQIGGLKQKQNDNEKAKEKLKQKQDIINHQRAECQKWDKLHELIGSADGKKFRNFAQGLTFEVMVSHANKELQKMTDRYLLIRDDKQPLELNIIDNYQAGEIRSTRNLSGGESFIVSLSLALGLASMVSRNVRVDSLFLDEGFGTLDEDTLESALEALAGLHRQGKLIGIISHVPILKQRIGTRINIIPTSGGKSTLMGPGCRGLEN